MIPLRLILGSTSPRRREILQALRISFVVRGASADENVLAGETPDRYLERVVVAKLDAVRTVLEPADRDAGAILVADTTVIHRGTIMGKPETAEESRTIIAALSGQTHEVKTRFALAPVEGELFWAETVMTQVTFRELDTDEIDDYVASGEGMDKAGAYGAQGLGGSLIRRIDGSYSNVIGLPACEVSVALRRHVRR